MVTFDPTRLRQRENVDQRKQVFAPFLRQQLPEARLSGWPLLP